MDAVDFMIAHIGIGEVPPRSNNGPCMIFALPGEPPAAWCMRAVRAAFIAWGHPLPGKPYSLGSCSYAQNALEAVNAWIPIEIARDYVIDGVGVPEALPQRNDVIIFNEHSVSDIGRVGHHAGVVEHYDPTTKTIHTLEGNWSDVLERHVRPLMRDDLWGIGRWPQ